MLVHDFTYVALPATVVSDRILTDTGSWLSPLAAAAAGDGEKLRMRIGPSDSLPLFAKTVNVEVGQPLSRGDLTIVPMTWRATGLPELFPVLTADLEVAPLDDWLCQLSLRGRYDPPIGVLGRHLDRLLLHRVAERSIRSFLRKLADALASSEKAQTRP